LDCTFINDCDIILNQNHTELFFVFLRYKKQKQFYSLILFF